MLFVVIRARYGTVCEGKEYDPNQASMPGKMESLQSLMMAKLASKYIRRQFVLRYLDNQRNVETEEESERRRVKSVLQTLANVNI